jgi:hypothetical protein
MEALNTTELLDGRYTVSLPQCIPRFGSSNDTDVLKLCSRRVFEEIRHHLIGEPSFLKTRAQGQMSAQIDHFNCRIQDQLKMMPLKGTILLSVRP